MSQPKSQTPAAAKPAADPADKTAAGAAGKPAPARKPRNAAVATVPDGEATPIIKGAIQPKGDGGQPPPSKTDADQFLEGIAGR